MRAAPERAAPPAGAGEVRLDPEEDVELLLRDLGTSRRGLSPREAARRLEQYGPNEIRRREQRSRLRDLAAQFTHPLALLLWVAAVLAVVGGIVPLAIAIVAVIVLNAVFAFGQELEAERATEALRDFLPPQARVRRGGREVRVDATTLVPGDLLLVAEGKTNREIAAELFIAESTVNFHMKNILSKLHLRNRAEAVAYALRSGLVEVTSPEP